MGNVGPESGRIIDISVKGGEKVIRVEDQNGGRYKSKQSRPLTSHPHHITTKSCLLNPSKLF
jgi:hypothetical protein